MAPYFMCVISTDSRVLLFSALISRILYYSSVFQKFLAAFRRKNRSSVCCATSECAFDSEHTFLCEPYFAGSRIVFVAVSPYFVSVCVSLLGAVTAAPTEVNK